jgi:hypothetical protein
MVGWRRWERRASLLSGLWGRFCVVVVPGRHARDRRDRRASVVSPLLRLAVEHQAFRQHRPPMLTNCHRERKHDERHCIRLMM